MLILYQGYLEIQGTKPQTLAYSLVDSPLGMLAWIRDKVEHLVDDDFTWEEEEIITWAMVRPCLLNLLPSFPITPYPPRPIPSSPPTSSPYCRLLFIHILYP